MKKIVKKIKQEFFPPYSICSSCGDWFYPKSIVNSEKMQGITICEGNCRVCGRKKVGLVPVRDYWYAIGIPGIQWD